MLVTVNTRGRLAVYIMRRDASAVRAVSVVSYQKMCHRSSLFILHTYSTERCMLGVRTSAVIGSRTALFAVSKVKVKPSLQQAVEAYRVVSC
jgi:hypothetical protein